MDTYDLIKKQILEINQELLNIIATASEFQGSASDSFDAWAMNCHTIEQQVKDDLMRVAVVGTIKSGKSTFVNALFQGDYLKRGAGVVTSMVTRICQGPQLKARLFFKTWNEINADINRAMVLFPAAENFRQSIQIDIRREEDRRELAAALSELQSEQLISRDTRNAASVLLSSYLKGYEQVKTIVSDEQNELNFDADSFEDHRNFVGDDALSVYLNDIQLEIVSEEFGQNLEIADCQGSDSPNPLHLAMIQDYLVRANLIIYAVSSRTGIRQADIRFLSMIKKMGLTENTFFVINIDFSEHDTIEDLQRVLEKITEDVALIVPSPEMYSFSSLYHLFKNQSDPPAPKDGDRIRQWERLPEIIAHHSKEFDAFAAALQQKVTDERAILLSKNYLARQSLILAGLTQWVGFNKNMLVRDSDSVKQISRQINHHKGRIEKSKKLIRSTLDGAVTQIKKELRREIDRFFDTRSGSALKGIIDFVKSYPIGDSDYTRNLMSKGFAGALFLVYQDFKQAVDLYMAERVNPEIVQLMRKLEGDIISSLKSVSEPFEAMVEDALKEYGQTITAMGIGFPQSRLSSLQDIDLKNVKQSMGLNLPTMQAAMQYSAKIKTEAVARLGYYTVVRLTKKIFKKRISHEKEGELRALKVGVRRMKREMEKSIDTTFKDYRENIKFQYLFKLTDAMADDLYVRLLDQFQAYATDLSTVMGDFADKRTDKSELVKQVNQIENSVTEIDQKIEHIKKELLIISG